jgi:hypothetical protein
VYPNPASSTATLHFHLVRDAGYELNVYDLNGKVVYTKPIHNYLTGDNNATIPVSALSAGIYIAQLKSDTESKTFKIIVAH